MQRKGSGKKGRKGRTESIDEKLPARVHLFNILTPA